MEVILADIEYKNCFLCGSENPIGLKLEFTYKENMAIAEWKAQAHFEGYEGIIHGGIIASLLDEAMAKIILKSGIIAVTSELSVKYYKPFPSDAEVIITGSIAEQRSKIITVFASIFSKGNPKLVFARGDAKYFVLKPVQE